MMTARDQIYAQILHFGLVRLRDSARLGYAEYCAVEADHLHNLPSLMGETNEHRHQCYFDEERSYYLKRVDRSIPGIDFTLRRYEELWQLLIKLQAKAESEKN